MHDIVAFRMQLKPGNEGLAQVRAVIYFFSSLFGIIPVYTENYI